MKAFSSFEIYRPQCTISREIASDFESNIARREVPDSGYLTMPVRVVAGGGIPVAEWGVQIDTHRGRGGNPKLVEASKQRQPAGGSFLFRNLTLYSMLSTVPGCSLLIGSDATARELDAYILAYILQCQGPRFSRSTRATSEAEDLTNQVIILWSASAPYLFSLGRPP